MNVKYEQLPSNLLVATDEMRDVETVSILAKVKTGSRNEDSSNWGISHFLEHMAFKGTHTRSALKIAEEFDKIGGYFNAYTSRETTVYYCKVLASDVDLGLDILSDILLNSKFEEEEIAKEKDVVLQEIAQTNDTPDDLIFDLFHATAYGDQVYGRTILGTPESVNAITREQIISYVDANYAQDNMIVSAAGKVKHGDFLQKVAQKFGALPSVARKIDKPAFYTGGDVRVQRDLEQMHLVMGFSGVPFTHEAYYDHQVLSLILGGGMSSRLFQEVREKRGLAYAVSAYCANYRDAGMFNIYSAVSPEKAGEYLKVTRDELFKIGRNISDDELDRAKSQIRASILMSMESTVARGEKLSGNLTAYGRYISADEVISKINSVTLDTLAAAAENIFMKKSKPTLASIGKVDKLIEYEGFVSLFQG